MIRLHRPNPPTELTSATEKSLANEYKTSGKAVWNEDYIKAALLAMSHNKCCYCECSVATAASYVEVDHYHAKISNPDLVATWTNLLPACKRCNSTKQAHDTKACPIIDPTNPTHAPQSRLRLVSFRLVGRDALGSDTVTVLNLNDLDRLARVRFDLGNAACARVDVFHELAMEFDSGASVSPRRRNRLINGAKELLKEAQPTAEFSATMASVVLSYPLWEEFKAILVKHSLWDAELVALETTAQANRL